MPPRGAWLARRERRPGRGGALRRRAALLGEGLPVTWLPRRDDVVSLLRASDVACVPSVWPEPLSRSIMEALACGVPVVATAVGGSPEILKDWMGSLLAAPDDPDDLARHLLEVLDWRERDPRSGTALSTSGRGAAVARTTRSI